MNNFKTIRTGPLGLIILLSLFFFVGNVYAQESADLVETGDQLLFESDFPSAEEAYNAAIEADPDYAVAYAHRCYLRAFQRQLKEAVADCQQAITLAPQDAEGYIYLTRAYDWSGEYEKAVEAGEQAIQLAPDSGLAHSFLGEVYLDLERMEEGEREVRLGVELAPETAEVHRNLGYFYGLMGDVEGRLNELEEATRLAPNFVPYLGERASIYLNQAQYDVALDYYKDILLIYQKVEYRVAEGRLLNHIGLIYERQGRYTEALDIFQQALVVNSELGSQREEIRALNGLGLVYDAQDRYNLALESYQKALAIAREVKDRVAEAAMLNNIGAIYEKQGNYTEGLEIYQKVLVISREVNDKDTNVSALNNVGLIYEALGRYAEALDSYQQALTLAHEIENKVWEGTILNNIGAIYRAQGDYALALDNYQQVLSLMREVENRSGEGVLLNNIGTIYDAQGHYIEALDYYQQALTIRREVGDQDGEGTTLDSIGGLYQKQGRYALALETLQQALAIRLTIGDRAGESRTLNNIGAVYKTQGRLDLALDHYQQALTIRRELGDQAGESRTLHNIGAVYYDQGLYEEALEQYQQALAISREIGDRTGEGQTLNNIGSIYEDQRHFDLALEHYQQALAILRQVGDRAVEGATLHNIGSVYYAQGLYVDALELYEQALAIAREVGDQTGEGATLNNIGSVYKKQNDPTQALAHYEQAMTVVESVRAVAGSEEGRSGFIALFADLYDSAVEVYYQQGQYEEAFRTSERGRARTFLDSLATGEVQLTDSTAADLLVQERALYAERLAIRDALAVARALNPPSPESVAELEAKLNEIVSQYASVLSEIEELDEKLLGLIPGRTKQASLSEIQQELDASTTLVSYYILGNDETLAFLITSDELKVVPLGVGSEALSEHIDAFYAGFTNPFLDEVDPHTSEELQQLHEWLISPLKPHLRTPGVTIIAHGILHYLPFAALTDGETYFSDDYVLSSLPSTSVLPLIQENRPLETSIESVLALGNPSFESQKGLILSDLPLAVEEVETLANLFGDNVQTLFGADATESTFREEAGHANIVHVAAHGIYKANDPLSSVLLLADDNTNDGQLEVREVYGLELTDTTLVVLSACETGIRSGIRDDESVVSAGDEIVALNRAFLFAGTPSVLSTLWSVEDAATAQLMERFYTHLQAGMGKAEALRQAQNEVRAEKPHPYYWAGFVLSGDGGDYTNEVMTPESVVTPSATPKPVVTAETTPAPTATASPPTGPTGNWPCLSGVLLLGVATLAGMGKQRRKARSR